MIHNELLSLEVMSLVPKELSNLYAILEKEFHPLDMIKSVKSGLEWVEQQENLKKYLPQLRKIILLRVLKQMESVFSVMKLQNYSRLLEDLHFKHCEVITRVFNKSFIG